MTLVPLSRRELETFIEEQIAEFADEKRRAGHWTSDEAINQSRKSIRSLLGKDPARRGHRFFKGLDARGKRVGWIWIGAPPAHLRQRGAQWLYQITVDESVRGRGFGRGMLVALEKILAGERVEFVYLNVFKWNRVARNLYDSLGYEVVLETDSEANMRKRLSS